ncbi:unnamed protein product, partial [Discosporangium mesarthrocarpum]
YQQQHYQEEQAKAHQAQQMIEKGEMVPGSNLSMDKQNEQQLPGVLRAACNLSPELMGGGLDKVERIVRLWESNSMYTPRECSSLLASAASVTASAAEALALARKAAQGLKDRGLGVGGWERGGRGRGRNPGGG